MEELPTLVQKLTERKAGPGAAGQRSAAELASPAAEFPGHTPHHDTSRSLHQSVKNSHLCSTNAGPDHAACFALCNVGTRASSKFCA